MLTIYWHSVLIRKINYKYVLESCGGVNLRDEQLATVVALRYLLWNIQCWKSFSATSAAVEQGCLNPMEQVSSPTSSERKWGRWPHWNSQWGALEQFVVVSLVLGMEIIRIFYICPIFNVIKVLVNRLQYLHSILCFIKVQNYIRDISTDTFWEYLVSSGVRMWMWIGLVRITKIGHSVVKWAVWQNRVVVDVVKMVG